MAFVSDVNNALVTLIGGVLYPSGAAGNPPSPVLGVQAKIFPGWPSAAQLDADLRAGLVCVSVFSEGSSEQNTTRFSRDRFTSSVQPATFTATVDSTGKQVTIAGSQPGTFYQQNVAVLINGLAFVYPTVPSDTPATIAAGLVALINPVVPCSAAGAVLTLPSTSRGLVARVGTTGTSISEIKRQQRQFTVTVWAPTPALRDAAAGPLDQALAAVEFLALADGSGGRIIHQRTRISDEAQKENLWRADMIYAVEYGTTNTETDAQAIVTTMNVTGGLSPTGTLQSSGPTIGTFNQ